ncbi:hypothetical protein ACJMK2_008279 [Sinanodonta woodiana]|uniref:Uncharacterized protein n=1 Tax=Sinanodonta woodiana TaxID=1069815 RepID=A0ABD3VPD9_SINWO
MSSSYKPKKFRNINGCCICGTKSSSSRFTDSKKYEPDFKRCFQIVEERSGDICNACVLLVKRYRKLPNDTDRHWKHVVDARTGPGSRSAMKNRNKQCQSTQQTTSSAQPKTNAITKPSRSITPEVLAGCSKSGKRKGNSRRQCDSDDSEEETGKVKYKKIITKKKKVANQQFNLGARSNYWTPANACCGMVFYGKKGEVVVNTKFYKPCNKHHPDKVIQDKEKEEEKETQLPMATASKPSSSKTSSDETDPSSTSDDSNPITSDIAGNDTDFSKVRKVADLIACG